MSDRHDGVRFAPAAVLRAAAWPAAELAELGSDFASSGASTYAARVEHGERQLARDREVLWRKARDVDFLKALTVANPGFAARAASRAAGGASAKRVKRHRHAETTLYRYWARAAGRATPADLWAGLTVVSLGPKTTITQRPPRRVFLPDLGAFRAMLAALGRQQAYRRRSTYHVNPTVAGSGDTVRFATRDDSGRVGMRELTCSPAMLAVIEALPVVGRPHGEIAATLSALGAPDALQLVDTLVQQGLLVGGLDLPARFHTAWQALEQVELHTDAERDAWQRAIDSLAERGEALQQGFERLGPDDIAAELERARATMATLRGQLGVECKLPARALRCDLRLGVHVQLGPDVLGDLARHLEAYCAAWGEGSPLVAYRQAFRARLRAFVDQRGGSIVDAPLCDALRARPARTWDALLAAEGRQLEAPWASWLASEQDALPPAGAPAGPAGEPALGCLLLGLTSGAPSIVGTSSDVAGAFARHALTDDVAPLSRWLSRELAASDETIVELIGALLPGNANAMARAEVDLSAATLWASGADATPLRGARLCFDERDEVRLLLADGRRASARTFCSANLAFSDPFATLALTSSGRTRAAWARPAALFPVQQELAEMRYRPALRCEHGPELRAPRTVLAGDTLHKLQRERRMGRFAAWQKLAARLQWPAELDVIRDGAEPLRVLRDSPLAVEALFEGFSDPDAVMIVGDARPAAFDIGGARVVADVAIPYAR